MNEWMKMKYENKKKKEIEYALNNETLHTNSICLYN